MKSLLLSEYNHLEIADLPLPAVGADDVLVRVEACGICGSDVHGYDGSTGPAHSAHRDGSRGSGHGGSRGRECAWLRQGRPRDLRLDHLLRRVRVLRARRD